MAPACTSWCIPKSRHFLQYSQRARAPVKCPPPAPAEPPSLPPRRPPRHPRSPPPPRRPAAHRRRRAAHHPDCSQAGGATLHQLRFVSRIVMGLYISRLSMPSSTELTVHDYAPIWAAHKFQRRSQTRLVFASLVSLALLLASLPHVPLVESVCGVARWLGIKWLVALAWSGTDAQKEWAAGALGNLADDRDPRPSWDGWWRARGVYCYHKVAIARAGGIEPLVKLVRSGTDEQKEQAVRALSNLAAGDYNNKVAIARAGGIEPLVKAAKNKGLGSPAAKALAVVQCDDDNKVFIARAGVHMEYPPSVLHVVNSSDGYAMWLIQRRQCRRNSNGGCRGRPSGLRFMTKEEILDSFMWCSERSTPSARVYWIDDRCKCYDRCECRSLKSSFSEDDEDE